MAELEDRGLPTVYVATTEFSDGGAAQAKALGADPAAVFVHHPIQDRTDEEMREIATNALAPILNNLLE
jgi:hypothetical protein